MRAHIASEFFTAIAILIIACEFFTSCARPEDSRIPQADLEITASDITFSTSDFSAGSYVNISVVVHNIGNAPAGTFQVRYADNATGTFLPLLDTLQGCPEYSETQSTSLWLPITQGVHMITVTADATGLVAESDETNNRASIEVHVGATQSTIIIDEALSPNPCMMNENVWSNGTAELITGQPASNASVVITLDKLDKKYETTTNAAGEFSFQFTSPSKVGKYEVNISVEKEEFRGLTTDILEVKRQEYPDVIVTGISVSPQTPYVGSTAIISATIHNKGAANASDVFVEIFVDGIIAGEESLPNLAAGATSIASVSWVATKGTHNVTLRINNIASAAIKEFNVVERSQPSIIPQSMGFVVVAVVISGAAFFVWYTGRGKGGIRGIFSRSMGNRAIKGKKKRASPRVELSTEDE